MLIDIQGSLFGPYTPLQQLDVLADFGTKSYIVGSTNSLLLQQRDRYSDILINLDEMSINITSASLRSALALSSADRRWIDFITQSVNDTWDESNPERPKTMGYVGSEEFIRLQFEEYLLSLISAVKCHDFLALHANNPNVTLPQVDGDPASDFGVEWIEAWSRTENYRIFHSITDSHLFDIVEPRHPCAGGLTIDDVQRRLAQQVQDLHLDERFAVGKEALGRNIAAGKERASTVFNKLYADMEALREARRKHDEQKAAAEKNGTAPPADTKNTQAAVASVGSKAGAYLGSWASWAGEKRKHGWGKGGKEKANKDTQIKNLDEKPKTPVVSHQRSQTQESFEESIFDADHHAGDDGEESDLDMKKRLKEEALAKIHEVKAGEDAKVGTPPEDFEEIEMDRDVAKERESPEEHELPKEHEIPEEHEMPKEDAPKEGFAEDAHEPMEAARVEIELEDPWKLEADEEATVTPTEHGTDSGVSEPLHEKTAPSS